MNKLFKSTILAVSLNIGLGTANCVYADQQSKHNSNSTESSEHAEEITISEDKIRLANIKVDTILPKKHYSTVFAPGEIKVNGYTSYIVSPRTESVIIERHAILGENIKQGQKLVTLFSESIAQAQADYLIASTEWLRIKKLDNKTVSESRLLKAKTDYNASYGKLLALGLSKAAIAQVSSNKSTLFGRYTLVAERAGIVLQDNFSQGQRVSAGESIMLLADDKSLWLEARIAANKNLNIMKGSPAFAELDNVTYPATVIQESHVIDPITRTRVIRLAINNIDDKLHSGMFVKVHFLFETVEKVMAVPEEALIRGGDGDWTVFIEDHPGEFISVEVERGRLLGDLREISGIEEGSRVVTRGAFFVASEIAKDGFDPHGH